MSIVSDCLIFSKPSFIKNLNSKSRPTERSLSATIVQEIITADKEVLQKHLPTLV